MLGLRLNDETKTAQHFKNGKWKDIGSGTVEIRRFFPTEDDKPDAETPIVTEMPYLALKSYADWQQGEIDGTNDPNVLYLPPVEEGA